MDKFDRIDEELEETTERLERPDAGVQLGMEGDEMTTTIYKTPNCPRCRELAAYLTQLEVDFDEQDMSSSEVLTDLRCEGVFVMEAPVLRVGNTYHNTNILWNGPRLAAGYVASLFGRGSE